MQQVFIAFLLEPPCSMRQTEVGLSMSQHHGRQANRCLLAFVLALLVSGCAHHYTDATVSVPYGFFSGIWHGVIFPFALLTNIISWILGLFGFDFLMAVEIIGRPNTGFFFYYVGFFLGLSVYGGGTVQQEHRSRS